MIYYTRLTSKQYKPPKRNNVGEPLLEDNFEHVKGNNNTQLQKYFTTYGMTAMGDGSTIVKMPLSNVLASTYGTAPVVLKVND